VRICVSVATEKVSEAERLAKEAEKAGADLIELRLDYLHETNKIEKIVESTSLPLIATNRQFKQGGHRLQNEKERVQSLLDAAELGFKYVDIELTTPNVKSITSRLKELGAVSVISFHDFERTPELIAMRNIVKSQIKTGGDICKLVTTATSMIDNISCLLLDLEMSETTGIVCFAMGKKGIVSRVLSPAFGANFTYASVDKGLETAPGQLSISELKRIYKSLVGECL
jgi:3-dehydroquinate dehydratase type I